MMMWKYIKICSCITFCLLIFSSCSSSVSDSVLDKCNKQQVECNSKAHKSSCGADDSSCVRKMLTEPNWSAKSFDEELKKCTEDYQQCLKP